MFSYDLASAERKLDLELRFPDTTPELELFIADQRLAIDAGGLHAGRVQRDEKGSAYQRYLGFDLAAGSSVALVIRPLPPPAQSSPLWTAALAALLGAGTMFWVGRPVTRALAIEAPEPESDAAKEALFSALRDLEHDFETGKLSQQDRDRLRQELRRDTLEALAREAGSPVAPEPREPECASCGMKTSADARFCGACGARL